MMYSSFQNFLFRSWLTPFLALFFTVLAIWSVHGIAGTYYHNNCLGLWNNPNTRFCHFSLRTTNFTAYLTSYFDNNIYQVAETAVIGFIFGLLFLVMSPIQRLYQQQQQQPPLQQQQQLFAPPQLLQGGFYQHQQQQPFMYQNQNQQQMKTN
jgi:hypothetical protein